MTIELKKVKKRKGFYEITKEFLFTRIRIKRIL